MSEHLEAVVAGVSDDYEMMIEADSQTLRTVQRVGRRVHQCYERPSAVEHLHNTSILSK